MAGEAVLGPGLEKWSVLGLGWEKSLCWGSLAHLQLVLHLLGLMLGLVPVPSRDGISSPTASSWHAGPSQVRDGCTQNREVPEDLLAFPEPC